MLSIGVKYRAPISSSPELSAREFRQVLSEAWKVVGWELFNRFVDLHFTREGGKQYNYAPRAGEGVSGKDFWRSYTGRKQKKMHHTNPLVWSGRTREGARRATIYANSNGVRVALPGAVHLNQYKPPPKRLGPNAGQQIDLREELLRVAVNEREALAKLHEETVIRILGSKAAYAEKQMK